ncbi:MAG TPA: RNHCP domain-containing protein [Planctomycetota bacterium]|nr:RNHCP domain-containing protein [Planctomycetota bacterium]
MRENFIGSGNDAFLCERCGAHVSPLAQGSYRNHCPECLWSRHVDRVPGDRACECGGLMEPASVSGSSGGEWVILHRCVACGFERRCRAALDDPHQPDRWERILELAAIGPGRGARGVEERRAGRGEVGRGDHGRRPRRDPR